MTVSKSPLTKLGLRFDLAILSKSADGALVTLQPMLAAVAAGLLIAGYSGKSLAAHIGLILLAGIALRCLILWLTTAKLYNDAYEEGLNLRHNILTHLIALPLGKFRALHSGRISQALSEDCLWLENHYSYTRPELSLSTVSFIILLCASTAVSPTLGLTVLVSMCTGFTILVLFQKRLAHGLQRRSQALAAASLTMLEYAEGISVLRMTGAGNYEQEAFQTSVLKLREGAKRAVYSNIPFVVLFRTIVDFSIALGAAAALLLLSTSSHVDPSHIASLIIAIMLAAAAAVPARSFGTFTAMLILARIGRDNIDAIMHLPQLAEGNLACVPDQFDVVYDDVCFSHEDSNRTVLDHISFHARQGSMTAIVGRNGSGKTTAVQLLMRFWDVTEGSIRIGERDIREFSASALSQLIAPVFQEALLFQDTIANNIRFGRPDASDDDVIKAAKAAAVHEMIFGLEKGYETVLASLGSSLSGGERQRIAIARALLKDSPIIILDEATSALDPENEEKVQEAINALVKNRTVFVIAHRLSTIINADQILVLDNGKLMDMGTHPTLLDRSSLYNRLWQDFCVSMDWRIEK
ncbi:ABC transporter ATP-binding protein [Phyllobacterium sp. SB3]|uniref:ABC transporter ATP-binding protein n=1 Tax=Phyllobacterium sp. SB3 TaxID=3156073 RepID=UPI0032AFBB50